MRNTSSRTVARTPTRSGLAKKGRSDLVRWWAAITPNVRLLPDDIAREFPDTESTVEALRLVIKLRAVKPKKPARKRKSA